MNGTASLDRLVNAYLCYSLDSGLMKESPEVFNADISNLHLIQDALNLSSIIETSEIIRDRLFRYLTPRPCWKVLARDALTLKSEVQRVFDMFKRIVIEDQLMIVCQTGYVASLTHVEQLVQDSAWATIAEVEGVVIFRLGCPDSPEALTFQAYNRFSTKKKPPLPTEVAFLNLLSDE
jgi:hypothetical protein